MKTPSPHITLILFLLSFSRFTMAQEVNSTTDPSFSAPLPFASSLYVIDSIQEVYSLSDHLEILYDENGTLAIEDLVSGSAATAFQSLTDSHTLTPNTFYWGRLGIKNLLDQSVSATEWVLSFSSLLTHIEVFLQESDQIDLKRTGTFLPVSSRDFSAIGDQNQIKINIPPGSQQTIYFRATSVIEQTIPIRGPKLRSMEVLLKDLAQQKKESGFFIGFMVMILVYSLILYFFQKDIAYLYYSGYVFMLILWSSFNNGELLDAPFLHLFDQQPQYTYFFKLATYLGLFSYLAFILTFLDLKKLLPWWHRVFKWMIWIGLPLFFIDAIILWTTNFSLARADRLSVFYILSFVILTYLFLWPLYKTRDKRGLFIILGMLAMGGGFLMTAIFYKFSTSGFTLTYFQIGTSIEVTIFSLGLAYRSNLVQKERQQAEYNLEKSKLQEQKQEAESRQLRELSEVKSRFYTNITHEFRTPLTVVIGMAEQLKDSLRNGFPKDKFNQGLQLIHRNSHNLLRLINQLLDLAKLDSGNLKLNLIQGDIVKYLQYLTESFYSLAEEKGIRLVFYPEEESLFMDYDEDKIQHIVYNLLSNAIKFTPGKGKIVFHVVKTEQQGQAQLQMRVKDTGTGIPADKLPHIFDRFYQVDNSSTRQGEGSGIGLALTKQLVELMQGDIEVKSNSGQGSTFEVRLPIRQTAPLQTASKLLKSDQHKEAFADSQSSSIIANTEAINHTDTPVVLIIEDNPDVVVYIQDLLKEDYTIQIAENGQVGIDRAIELVPDIIVSDVMMPEKDGYEVCKTLKADVRTSHIPIVLLTARATENDRIEGLQYGADAYLTKPFNKQELLIRVEKLIEIRQNLQRRFSNYPEQGSPDAPANATPDPEAAFLENLTAITQLHLENPDFGVPQLAQSIPMSQMQVYRKLKALIGKTPSHFIRSLRLQKGKELLQNSGLTIAEIAYEVGFSDPNYFSRTFHQEFKRPPSDFRK